MQRLIIALGLLLSGWTQAAELRLDFSQSTVNEPPREFRSTVTGLGKPGDWRIILDSPPALLPPISPKAPVAHKQPVLAQLAQDKTDEHFPLLIYEKEQFSDFTATLWFKLVAGDAEQMAGLAFRIKDERNYYYVRASGLGDSFYFFKIVNGERGPPVGNKVEISSGVWHKMTVTCEGNSISAFLNDQPTIPTLTDASLGSGKIGFWTKSDSVSHFSNIHVVYTPKEIFAQRLLRQVEEKFPRLNGVRLYAPGPDHAEPTLIASTNPGEIGTPATDVEKDVIRRGIVFHGKGKKTVTVTLPLHDNNGDTMAAVSVLLDRFPGQTEKNAMARALSIVREMESRVLRLEELHR